MVPSIARQSVIIKCNMQKSVLTGNYEFYYASGLVSKLAGLEIADDMKPEELQRLLAEKLPAISANDEREKYLFQMLMDFKASEEYDEQMQELLRWGKDEKNLWQVSVPV